VGWCQGCWRCVGDGNGRESAIPKKRLWSNGDTTGSHIHEVSTRERLPPKPAFDLAPPTASGLYLSDTGPRGFKRRADQGEPGSAGRALPASDRPFRPFSLHSSTKILHDPASFDRGGGALRLRREGRATGTPPESWRRRGLEHGIHLRSAHQRGPRPSRPDQAICRDRPDHRPDDGLPGFVREQRQRDRQEGREGQDVRPEPARGERDGSARLRPVRRRVRHGVREGLGRAVREGVPEGQGQVLLDAEDPVRAVAPVQRRDPRRT